MFLCDPNNLDAELDGADARLNWGNSFWDQGLSLETWLGGWAAGGSHENQGGPAMTGCENGSDSVRRSEDVGCMNSRARDPNPVVVTHPLLPILTSD